MSDVTMRSGKKWRELFLVLLITFLRISVASTDDVDETAISQSYVAKHSSAWRSFALANDIEKREKLKKALRGALHAVDARKSDIVATPEETSINRIKHAAMLLKEFQQLHKLSETVKRTLSNYQVAKSNLSKTMNDNGIGILKRFLVGRSKRTSVPRPDNTSVDIQPMKEDVLEKPHYLKRTDKISVIATPLNKTGDVGVEFISTDPKTSTLTRANKALKAAKILLKYAGNRKLRKENHIDSMVDILRKDIDGMYKDESLSSEKDKKSLLANKASLFLLKDDNKPVHPDTSPMKKGDIGSKKDESVSVSGNTLIAHSKENIFSVQNKTKKSDTSDISDKERLREEVEEEKADIRSLSEQEQEAIKNADILQNTLRQSETMRTLREAKLARQKYEIARHELAEKVKELYKMANQYEKDETDNQVLEVKNDNIPTVESLEDNVNVPHTKRDDSHPGLALSGVSQRAIKGISTGDTGSSEVHKAFTMGAIDKTQHQVTVNENKEKEAKALSVATTKNIEKIEKPKGDLNNNLKNEEESLKVIAQAIKEDMKDISKVEKKKKMVQEALSGNRGEIKEKQPNDKIDEYLTKALTDIMGNDAVAGNDDGKKAEEKQKERVENNKNTKDENMKIVAEAMKSSSNPDLPLPLVSSNGDKISLNKNPGDNKAQQRDSKDVFEHVTEHQSKPLDMSDPTNKALLDKAVHLEEQVAAQQDKLYNGQSSETETPGKANVANTADQPKITTSTITSTTKSSEPGVAKADAYGSIKETMDNPEERQRMMDEQRYGNDEEDDDDYEDDDDDDHGRRHYGHHPHYDDEDDDYDEEDRDDDDDHDDKRGHVSRYHDEDAEKRSFKTIPAKPSKKMKAALSNTGAPHYDDLEDVKRSEVPKIPNRK